MLGDGLLMLEICGMATVAAHEPAYSDANSQGSIGKFGFLESACNTVEIPEKRCRCLNA